MVNTYELMLLLKKDIAEEAMKKLEATISKLIAPEGKILSAKNLGRKKLAYPIKKESEAVYYLLNMEFAGKEVAVLSNKLIYTDQVLRLLFVKTEKKKDKSAARATISIKST